MVFWCSFRKIIPAKEWTITESAVKIVSFILLHKNCPFGGRWVQILCTFSRSEFCKNYFPFPLLKGLNSSALGRQGPVNDLFLACHEITNCHQLCSRSSGESGQTFGHLSSGLDGSSSAHRQLIVTISATEQLTQIEGHFRSCYNGGPIQSFHNIRGPLVQLLE